MKRGVILGIWQVLFLVAFLIPTAYADFGLMLGSFKNRANAQIYMEDFLKGQAGAKENAFLEDIQMPGEGIWYRVCLGPFVSREDAVRKQKFFQSRGHDSVIVSVKTSEIAHPSGNPRESNSGTLAPSSGTDAVHPENPPLVSANASVPKDIDAKAKGWHKVGIPSYVSGEKVALSVNSPKMGVKPQGEDRVSYEPQEETVVVSAGDIVGIEIPGQKQMSHNYDLDPEGRIFMMSAGEIMVGGLDLSLVTKKITTILKQLVPKGEKPVVSLLESMRYINISGGVNYPGWYRVPAVSNLDDLVEMAGGLVAGADFSQIKIKRSTKSGVHDIKVRGKVSLEPNDVLVVPTPERYERKIDSGDLLFINIPERSSEPGLSEIERKVTQNKIEVDKSGYIYIPEYGHIYVKNLLTTEVSKIITNQLPKYLARSAKVHVNIIEKKHYVQIGGHVATPGWYSVPESDNIQAALSVAGGAVDGAI